jgi:hypothetical protein
MRLTGGAPKLGAAPDELKTLFTIISTSGDGHDRMDKNQFVQPFPLLTKWCTKI